MATARFRFYGELNDFLSRPWRQMGLEQCFDRRTSVKDMIEAIGVPHPEIALIIRRGDAVGFDCIVEDGDRFAVYPVLRSLAPAEANPLDQRRPLRFVLDANLGALARNLRHCGFDARYRNDIADHELARLAADEDRIVLTRDRGALKRRIVERGYCVRSDEPREQLREVFQRFAMHDVAAPLTRCARCNGTLAWVAKEAIVDRLEPLTRRYFDYFRQCRHCGQIYWRGSHVRAIEALVQGVAGGADGARAHAESGPHDGG